MIDALNRRTEYVYDDVGRLVETIYPDDTPGDTSDNLRMQTGYDTIGRKTSETDLAGLTTRFEYDGVGNLTAVIDALNQRTEYGYDEQSNKTSQTDAALRTTTWGYDDAGRVISRSLPEGQQETFSYDNASNRTGHIDFNGASHTFGFDSLNRETTATYADGIVVTTTYTDTGQVETVTDDRGTTRFAYDERERLTRITYPTGRTIDYGYDDAGNRTSLTTANQALTYTFDVLNRLETVTDEAGTSTYGYDAVGNRASLTHANGTRTSYTYDPLYRLLELSHSDSTDTLIDRHTYTLGDNGNRTQHAELNGRTVDYTYDDLYRLLTETVTDPTLGNRSASWTYDAVGNGLTQMETDTRGTTTTTYVYDDNDRLTSETAVGAAPSTTSYTYDNNGNTLTRVADGVTTTYAYDSRNHLINLNMGQVTYRYDASGIRMSETAAGLTTNYLVDPNRDYAQVIEESFDLSAEAEVRYTYGDDLIAQHRRTGPTTTESRTFHYDGLGSTRLLTDTTGATTDTYAFTAFGELENSAGVTVNDYLYTGEQYDPNLGFYYLRARYYNPAIGRFPTMDTYAGRMFEPMTLHKYLYANANSPNMIDPSGRVSIAELTIANNVAGFLTQVRIGGSFDLLSAPLESLGQPGAAQTVRDVEKIIAITALGAAGLQLVRTLAPAVWRVIKKNVGREVPANGQTIALGLGDYLDSFTHIVNGKNWRSWAREDPLNWKLAFTNVVSNPSNKVAFNLTGVNVQQGISRAAAGRGGNTDWELLMIRSNKDWWSRITWYRDGKVVANPFE